MIVQTTTTAAIADHAYRRLSGLLAEALRYHASAKSEAGRHSRPWADMIDVLLHESRGVGELAVLVAAIGDASAVRGIEADIRRTGERLIALSSEARLSSWRPAAATPA